MRKLLLVACLMAVSSSALACYGGPYSESCQQELKLYRQQMLQEQQQQTWALRQQNQIMQQQQFENQGMFAPIPAVIPR